MTKQQATTLFKNTFSNPKSLQALEVVLDPDFHEQIAALQHLPKDYVKAFEALEPFNPQERSEIIATVPGMHTTLIGLGMGVVVPEFDLYFKGGQSARLSEILEQEGETDEGNSD